MKLFFPTRFLAIVDVDDAIVDVVAGVVAGFVVGLAGNVPTDKESVKVGNVIKQRSIIIPIVLVVTTN